MQKTKFSEQKKKKKKLKKQKDKMLKNNINGKKMFSARWKTQGIRLGARAMKLALLASSDGIIYV